MPAINVLNCSTIVLGPTGFAGSPMRMVLDSPLPPSFSMSMFQFPVMLAPAEAPNALLWAPVGVAIERSRTNGGVEPLVARGYIQIGAFDGVVHSVNANRRVVAGDSVAIKRLITNGRVVS